MTVIKRIRTKLEQQVSLGVRNLGNGTILIGHAPYIAPGAWLHAIFPPLSQQKIDELEKEMKVGMPEDYRNFLSQSNGLRVFMNSITLYGFVESIKREDTDHSLGNPFSIIRPNLESEKPADSLPEYVFIGSYRKDGSRLYINSKTNEVHCCSRTISTPIKTWSCFELMLISEIDKFCLDFKNNGDRVDHPLLRKGK